MLQVFRALRPSLERSLGGHESRMPLIAKETNVSLSGRIFAGLKGLDKS